MKKAKYLGLFLLVISPIFLLAACTKQSNNVNGDKATSSNAENLANRRPDFGQPDRQADVYGLVKSVTGNQVTIIKLDRPERATGTPDNANGTNNNGNNAQRQGGGNFIRGGAGGGIAIQGGGGGNQFFVRGGGPGGAEGDSSQARQQMIDRLKAMSTGDETVIIPVGIKMLKPDPTVAAANNNSGQRQQPNMVEATLADITSDKMIQVWLDPNVTDRKVAEFVLVLR